MKTHRFCVADFTFSVTVPEKLDIESLLPSFKRFRADDKGEAEDIFTLETVTEEIPCEDGAQFVGDSVNDIGYTRLLKIPSGYRVELRFTENGVTHVMTSGEKHRKSKAFIDWRDPYAGQVLSSLLRIAYSQAVVWHNAVSVHASVVAQGGLGYLFMGKSGTGKSTHAALWQQAFKDCTLLNDDNPTMRMIDGHAVVFGSPWSGKTPCYKNESCRLAGIVRLQQAQANRFVPQQDVQAFMAMLPGCSAIRSDNGQYDAMCATLIDIVSCTPVGIMECLPDVEAAEVCRRNFD